MNPFHPLWGLCCDVVMHLSIRITIAVYDVLNIYMTELLQDYRNQLKS